MRYGALALGFLLLVPTAWAGGPGPGGAGGPAPAGGAPLLLREAARQGLVDVLGTEPDAYTQVTVRVHNRGRSALSVDLCGSYLVPRPRGSCQRLGLGPEITPRLTRHGAPGRILLDVPAAGDVVVRLHTVCLDAGRAAPQQQRFDVAQAALPPVREKVMRWWADHPGTPQYRVNSAIWQNSDVVRTEPGVVPTFQRPEGTFGTLLGGTAYRLKDGELTSVDPDGVVRFLGTEIFQALPTPGALYAIALDADRRPALWRLALTGEELWGRVMPLDVTEPVLEVLAPVRDRLVIVTQGGVRIANLATGRTTPALLEGDTLCISTRQPRPGRLTVVLGVRASPGHYQGGVLKGQTQDVFALWSVDLSSGRASEVKRYWNVRSTVAGDAGVYGLSHVGVLRVLVGRDFHDLPAPEEYDRLLAVGRRTLWLATRDGEVVAASPRDGSVRSRTRARWDADTTVSLDPVTDDLALVKAGVFRRVRAADGKVEDVGTGAPGR